MTKQSHPAFAYDSWELLLRLRLIALRYNLPSDLRGPARLQAALEQAVLLDQPPEPLAPGRLQAAFDQAVLDYHDAVRRWSVIHPLAVNGLARCIQLHPLGAFPDPTAGDLPDSYEFLLVALEELIYHPSLTSVEELQVVLSHLEAGWNFYLELYGGPLPPE